MVAPHAGAWIETPDAEASLWGARRPSRGGVDRNPFWEQPPMPWRVAPHAGAWIETGRVNTRPQKRVSPLTRGRG